jgi:uncharacterized membrane protein
MRSHLDVAQQVIGADYASLDELTQNVTRHIAKGKPITRHPSGNDDAMTRGQRAADAVARFGGSWAFIGIFALILLVWVALNSLILVRYRNNFDPYPYILLNLMLSMTAAIQAPIILMSQNRQTEKDRIHAEHDYEVNLKAELEIMQLHEKIDALREVQWLELLDLQKQQMHLLNQLAQSK